MVERTRTLFDYCDVATFFLLIFLSSYVDVQLYWAFDAHVLLIYLGLSSFFFLFRRWIIFSFSL